MSDYKFNTNKKIEQIWEKGVYIMTILFIQSIVSILSFIVAYLMIKQLNVYLWCSLIILFLFIVGSGFYLINKQLKDELGKKEVESVQSAEEAEGTNHT